MAEDLNQCNFIGRLGKDPEIIYSKSGMAIAKFSLAVNDSKKTDSGYKDITDWVNMVAFGKQAEIIGQYMTKGGQLFVTGKFKTDKWEDKNGQTRYSTNILVNKFNMLGGKSDSAPKQAEAPKQTPAGDQPQTNGFDDDIPFDQIKNVYLY